MIPPLSEQIARLEAFRREPTITAAAHALGMTPRVLHQWLVYRGYHRPGFVYRDWTTAEIATLRCRVREGRSSREIAAELGRSDSSVREHAKRLGLRIRTRHRWTPGQRRVRDEIADNAVRALVQRLGIPEATAGSALIRALAESGKRRAARRIADVGGMRGAA